MHFNDLTILHAPGSMPIPLRDRAFVYRRMAWEEGLVTAALIGPLPFTTGDLAEALPTHLAAGCTLAELREQISFRLDQMRKRLSRLEAKFVPEFLEIAGDEEALYELATNWADGFVHGMSIERGSWASLLDTTGGQEALGPIAVWTLDDNADVIEAKGRSIASLGPSVWAMRTFWRKARHARESARKSEKHARNAPCPCGSGEKFKRCCMN